MADACPLRWISSEAHPGCDVLSPKDFRAAVFRKLVGRTLAFVLRRDVDATRGWFRERAGVLEEVRGRNLRMSGGSSDWVFVPDLVEVIVLAATEEKE